MLSVIIPSFNDSVLLRDTLPMLLSLLARQKGLSWEVIISDDGSQDASETRRITENLGITFLGHPVNQGKGAAVRRGILAARGAFRLFTDSDLPFPAETVLRFFHSLRDAKGEMVVGDRTLKESVYYLKVPFVRRWGSHLYAAIVSKFITGGCQDTQCGLKGFRADVAEDLFRSGTICRFGFDVELFQIAQKRRYRVHRLPVTLRFQGVSHVRVVRDGLRMFFDLLTIVMNRLRGRYDAPPARDRIPSKNWRESA